MEWPNTFVGQSSVPFKIPGSAPEQPRSRYQKSETPVGVHLQIVAQQIQDFRATLISLKELAATTYLRGRMDFIIALAMAITTVSYTPEFQAF